MEVVKREDITDDLFREILDVETHHNHEIIRDEHGTLRWKEDPYTVKCYEKISLNDLIPLFYALGIDKNHEIYRQLYRNIGYSLSGYWEIFYWEANNDDADLYNPPKSDGTNITPINPREIVSISLKMDELIGRLNIIGLKASNEIYNNALSNDKFNENWLTIDDENKIDIVNRINNDNIEPFEVNNSLHVCESRYMIDREVFRIITYIGGEGELIEKLNN